MIRLAAFGRSRRQAAAAAPVTGGGGGGAATTNLLSGLVAYYTLSNVNDSHSGSRTLTNNASVTFVAGKVGNCGRFATASSQYLSSNSSVFAITNDITVACWAKLASTGGFKRLVSRFVQGTGGYTLSTDNTLETPVGFGCMGVGGTANPMSGPLNTGQWYFLVGWFDSSISTAYLSVDNGTPISEAIALGGVMANPSVDFMIGAFDSPVTQYHDGDLDEVGVWSRILTATERTYLFNGNAGRTWPLQ